MPSLPNLDLHKAGDGVSVCRPDPGNKCVFPLSMISTKPGTVGFMEKLWKLISYILPVKSLETHDFDLKLYD